MLDASELHRAAVILEVDSRVVRLRVTPLSPHVHLNGRPVRRLGYIRGGDVLHLAGRPIRIIGRRSGQPVLTPSDAVVLRGVGGELHGRCFALRDGLRMGGGVGMDIPLGNGCPLGEQVMIMPSRIGVFLQVLSTAVVVAINGEKITESPLYAGDQIQVGHAGRFVVESVAISSVPDEGSPAVLTSVGRQEVLTPTVLAPVGMGWTWLLIAALSLSAVLAALLLFGAR